MDLNENQFLQQSHMVNMDDNTYKLNLNKKRLSISTRRDINTLSSAHGILELYADAISITVGLDHYQMPILLPELHSHATINN